MRARVPIVAIPLFVLAGAALWFLLPREPEAKDDAGPPWRRVLAFDVTKRDRDFKADLGNNQLVIAQYSRPIGWEIAVYAYPVSEDSDNLLAADRNWRGPQPWQSFAMTRRKQLYPDVRVIDYGPPGQKVKIVLENCKTEKYEGFARFTQGRIEVYYRPPES